MIFFNMGRTGGSAVWNVLAPLATKHAVRVIDLYEQSLSDFGTPFLAQQAVRKAQLEAPSLKWGNESPFLHHRTRQNIEAALPSEARNYVTLLRDPVERFLSDVFHVRKLMGECADLPAASLRSQAEISWYRKVFGESLYALFIQPDADLDELVLEASRCPYYENFYFNAFWSLLISPAIGEVPEYFSGVIDDQARLELLGAVHQRFAFIGIYPQLKQAISSISFLLGVPLDPGVDFFKTHAASSKPDLRRETLEKLCVANQDEYRLLAMFKTPDSVVAGLERAGEVQQKQKLLVESVQRMQRATDGALRHAEFAMAEAKRESTKRAKGLEHQLLGLKGDLSVCKKDAALAGAELWTAQNHIERLQKSTSWRITAPLRAIKSIFASSVPTATAVEVPEKSEEPESVPYILHEPTLTDGPAAVVVIMPTFNSARYVAEAIESVLEQSWQDLELAVLDGGSTDATVDIAKAYAVRDPRVSIRIYPGVHPTLRVDDFFRTTQSRWIAIQHSDDVSYTHRLERQIDAFLEDPELGVNSAMYRSFWHVRSHATENEGHHIHGKPQSHEQIRAGLLFWWVMHAPTLCFDREKALAVDLRFHNSYSFANDYWVTALNIDRLRYGNVQEELSATRIHWESDGSLHLAEIDQETNCLKRAILERYGFTFTEEQLALHCGITLVPARTLQGPAKDFSATLAWLDNLREQNRSIRAVDIPVFEALLDHLVEETLRLRDLSEPG
ncbi:MAG: glycosyltransferase family 2 protein [Janthinobacterium lividum]